MQDLPGPGSVMSSCVEFLQAEDSPAMDTTIEVLIASTVIAHLLVM
jgi:hypothetical protein